MTNRTKYKTKSYYISKQFSELNQRVDDRANTQSIGNYRAEIFERCSSKYSYLRLEEFRRISSNLVNWQRVSANYI